jgi:hypothetical protein
MAKLNPKDYQGQSPEVSDRDTALGVYVFQGKDENDQPVGEKKYIEARDPAHAEGFRSVGFRLASEAERKEYRQRVADAKAQKSADVESTDEEATKLQKQLDDERKARVAAEKQLEASEAERKAPVEKEQVEPKKENK